MTEYFKLLFRPLSVLRLIKSFLVRSLRPLSRRNKYSEQVYNEIAVRKDRVLRTKRTILLEGHKKEISEESWAEYECRKFDQIVRILFPALSAKSNLNVLEIGIGEGGTLQKIHDALLRSEFSELSSNINWFGCDLTYARLNNLKLNVNASVVNCDAKKLPYANTSFDIVYTHNVLEQIPRDFKYVVDEAMRIGGSYLAMEPTLEYGDLDAKINILLKDHLVGLEKYIKSKHLNYERIIPEVVAKATNPAMYYLMHSISEENNSEKEVRLVCPDSRQLLSKTHDSLQTADNKIAYPMVNNIPMILDRHKVNVEKNIRSTAI
ncbi:class I SAM-dependent methyltransferase [Gammaproteobacteria bacterium]|nr:class I SAM-dependent methyltransferase [Gammaproteobacteria bacterium]